MQYDTDSVRDFSNVGARLEVGEGNPDDGSHAFQNSFPSSYFEADSESGLTKKMKRTLHEIKKNETLKALIHLDEQQLSALQQSFSKNLAPGTERPSDLKEEKEDEKKEDGEESGNVNEDGTLSNIVPAADAAANAEASDVAAAYPGILAAKVILKQEILAIDTTQIKFSHFLRFVAIYLYLENRSKGMGKMEASGLTASLLFNKTSTWSYKARAIREWADTFLATGEIPPSKQGCHAKTPKKSAGNAKTNGIPMGSLLDSNLDHEIHNIHNIDEDNTISNSIAVTTSVSKPTARSGGNKGTSRKQNKNNNNNNNATNNGNNSMQDSLNNQHDESGNQDNNDNANIVDGSYFTDMDVYSSNHMLSDAFTDANSSTIASIVRPDSMLNNSNNNNSSSNSSNNSNNNNINNHNSSHNNNSNAASESPRKRKKTQSQSFQELQAQV